MLGRRDFLFGAAAAVTVPATAWPLRHAIAASVALSVTRRTIEVNGRAAKVFGIVQANGTHGLTADAGQRFQITLQNKIDVPTLIHWHGLTPPSSQDGVPGLSQPPLQPAGVYEYDFPLTRPGTNWMHSHVGFQEQQLMAAPLIVRDPRDTGRDEQEVVVLLHDFTFRDPEEIFAELLGAMGGMSHGTPTQPMQKGQGANPHAGMTTMRPATPGTPPPASVAVKADLNDVEYDAYLANDSTLADPEIVRVAPGGMVRLRLINGAASTNFFIDLGAIQGELIAVDGMPVRPIQGNRFEFAVAQRLDIRIKLPPGQGAYPVLAVREGDIVRTGVVLATKDARVVRIEEKGPKAASVVGLALERRLVAVEPLAVRNIDRTLALDLTGDMAKYIWTLNGKRYGEHSPLSVRRGERVAIVMRNLTEMSHPMHLHGHHFQVVEIDGRKLLGAMRDTVHVPAKSQVTIAFDADNPGHWAMHCHNSYHMAAGMMTSVKYEGLT